MPSTDLAEIAAATLPAEPELTLRYATPETWERSLICEGPLGAVELRVLLGHMMSLEFHARQGHPEETPVADCPVLGGDCWPDGSGLGVREKFEPLLRAGDPAAVLAELAASYHANNWTCPS